MKTRLSRWLVLIPVCLALSVPGAAAEDKTALDGIIDGHIVPRYQTLEAATGNLATAVQQIAGTEPPVMRGRGRNSGRHCLPDSLFLMCLSIGTIRKL